MAWTSRLGVTLETVRSLPKVNLANSKGLLGLIFIAAVALTACAGDSGAAATDIGPQPADALPAVSLSMDDYLGSTVVLYFSFPG